MLSHGGKAIRDSDGKIVKAAPYQSNEVTPGRVQPDRRWFGACLSALYRILLS